MSDLWYVIASLARVGHRRIVLYQLDDGEETFRARPNLLDISLYCKDACENLLKELQQKKGEGIDEDIEYVKGEIELLERLGAQWNDFSRAMWEEHREP
jgi:hypothetical protein